MTTRVPRPLALALILLIAATLVWAALLPTVPVSMANDAASYTDVNLYRDVAAAVSRGEPYYRAVADLHRAHGYPLQPFVVVRLPTLAQAAALLGWPVLRGLAAVLLIGGTLTWYAALEPLHTRSERLAAVAFAVMIGCGVAANGDLTVLHDGWAGLLLCPALAVLWRWPQRWPVAWVLAALALAVRELALPFVLLAGVCALVRRDSRQAAAWTLLVVLFVAGMAWHRAQVQAIALPGDTASRGWTALGGPAQFAGATIVSSTLQLLPARLAQMLALLPLFGWLALRGPRASFVWLWFAGMALAIALFARPDNVYWGFLLMPAYPIGLALVPRLVADLWRAARTTNPLAR